MCERTHSTSFYFSITVPSSFIHVYCDANIRTENSNVSTFSNNDAPVWKVVVGRKYPWLSVSVKFAKRFFQKILRKRQC